MCPSLSVQHHSLAVGHMKQCDKTTFHKMYNATHKLLVIENDEMRLPLQNMHCDSLAVGHKEQWIMYLSQHLQCHSLAVGQMKRCDETAFHKICNAPYLLLVIGKSDEIPFHKMSTVTYWLLVRRKDVMTLPFTK